MHEKVEAILKKYELRVGFEFHVLMDTKAKLFSTSPNIPNEEANTMASFVDIGMTGTLPVFNGECLDKAIRAGVAFKGQLSKRILFERKHSFMNNNP